MSDKTHTNQPSPSNQSLAIALNHHQQGNFSQAQKLYHAILQRDPNNVSALHLCGILAGQQGDYASAQTYIERALILEPNVPSFHNNLANALKNQGHLGAAIAHYKKALTLEPSNAAASNNLGILLYQNQQHPEAVTYYEAAIKIKPDYTDAYYHLGLTLLYLNKMPEAIKNFEQTLVLNPAHTEAQYQLAQIYHQQNDLPSAISYYKSCLALDPQHVESHHGLAAASTNLGNLDDALQYFTATLALQPDHHEARFNFASALLHQGKLNDALRHYLFLMEQQPNLDVYYNIGVIYMHQDRHQDAIQYFNEALLLDPQHLETHTNIAAVFLKTEDYQNASKHYEIVLKQQPDNPEIAYILNAINQNEASGKTFQAAPDQYVKNLFDQYAPHFDKHLTEYLYYQAPEQLHRVVTTLLASGKSEQDSDPLRLRHLPLRGRKLEPGLFVEEWTVLDLGCGTGLCGPLFRSLAKKLIGIDLSSKMLEMAKEKSVYDELQAGEMVAALSDYQAVDLMIAADVLPYLGELSQLFAAVRAALKTEGWFAFTTENPPACPASSPYHLQRSARFAHAPAYIQQLAQDHHFDLLHASSAILRNNRNQAVEGSVYVLAKSFIPAVNKSA